MQSDHHFETPEDVDLGFKLAGPASRFGAYFIDFIILALIRLVAAVFFIFIASALASNVAALPQDEFLDEFDGWVVAVLIILFFFSEYLYFGIFEWRRNGVTPGKKFSGLRAVMDGGYRLTPTAAWLRNLLRPIDTIPLAWLVPLADQKNRRLGDFVAGTVVVVELKAEAPVMPLSDMRYGELAVRHLELSRENLLSLRRRDYQALEEYLLRHRTIPGQRLGKLQKIMLGPMLERMDQEIPSGAKRHQVLSEIYLALRDTPGLLDLLED
jgi:uncharacterized RDD family membrane protein YckC